MKVNEILNIGENLKKIRKDNNLTQEQFAEKVGLARTTYANYEANKRTPDIETLNKIATIFNTTVEKILGNPFEYPGTKRLPRYKPVSYEKAIFSYIDLLDYAGLDFSLDVEETNRLFEMTVEYTKFLISNMKKQVLIIKPTDIDFKPNGTIKHNNK